MEWPDVQRRIAGDEDARTEFKRKLGDLRGVGRTVWAVANGGGSVAFAEATRRSGAARPSAMETPRHVHP